MDHEKQPLLPGLDLREEDLEPQTGLHMAARVFRVCSVIIALLALWQFAAWWMDRPPGGVGVGVLVGDTIRLIVVAGLLWGAGDLADLLIKTHYDVRAGRILLARQNYMLRRMAAANDVRPPDESMGDRRHTAHDPATGDAPGIA